VIGIKIEGIKITVVTEIEKTRKTTAGVETRIVKIEVQWTIARIKIEAVTIARIKIEAVMIAKIKIEGIRTGVGAAETGVAVEAEREVEGAEIVTDHVIETVGMVVTIDDMKVGDVKVEVTTTENMGKGDNIHLETGEDRAMTLVADRRRDGALMTSQGIGTIAHIGGNRK